jgi:quinol monooxygenase YgiN
MHEFAACCPQATRDKDRLMIQASFRLVASEEKRQEFLRVLMCLKGPTEALAECLACRVLQDVEDENVFTYVVTWEKQEDLEEHLRSDRFRRLLPYIEMSQLPPEVSFSTIDQVRGIEFMVQVLDTQPPT